MLLIKNGLAWPVPLVLEIETLISIVWHKTWCARAHYFTPICTKIHLRVSSVSKNFRGTSFNKVKGWGRRDG